MKSVLLLALFVLSGCVVLSAGRVPAPMVKMVSIDGVPVRYIEQGRGLPVVFVHGGVSDSRSWEAQRPAIAARHRFIALDQRYFGAAAWQDDGARFAYETHVSDLAAFVRALDAGPVYLVGHSYGAIVALGVAMAHPELVRALFINEPPLASVLAAPDELEVAAAEQRLLGPVVASVKRGDLASATEAFVDWVKGAPGAYAHLPPDQRQMHLDNARTLPLQMRATLATKITCEQLGAVRAPVTILQGERTRPLFRVSTEAVQRCIPSSRKLRVPDAGHDTPREKPAAFNAALLSFLESGKGTR